MTTFLSGSRRCRTRWAHPAVSTVHIHRSRAGFPADSTAPIVETDERPPGAQHRGSAGDPGSHQRRRGEALGRHLATDGSYEGGRVVLRHLPSYFPLLLSLPPPRPFLLAPPFGHYIPPTPPTYLPRFPYYKPPVTTKERLVGMFNPAPQRSTPSTTDHRAVPALDPILSSTRSRATTGEGFGQALPEPLPSSCRVPRGKDAAWVAFSNPKGVRGGPPALP